MTAIKIKIDEDAPTVLAERLMPNDIFVWQSHAYIVTQRQLARISAQQLDDPSRTCNFSYNEKVFYIPKIKLVCKSK